MLFSSSISVLLLVTNTIGISEKVRIPKHISKPLFPGSFISRITRCGAASFNCSIVWEKSVTANTSYPFPFKGFLPGNIITYLNIDFLAAPLSNKVNFLLIKLANIDIVCLYCFIIYPINNILYTSMLQHIFNKYSVASGAVLYENMGDGSDEFAVLNNGCAAHE